MAPPHEIPLTTYVTSHVGPHPMHRDYVRRLGIRVGRVDKTLRWMDRPRSRVGRYLSWLANGVALDQCDDAQIILSESFQIPPPLHKLLGRCGPEQLVVCHHVGEAPYFLSSGQYSRSTDFIMRRLLRAYDAHICVGREQERLVREALGPGAWNVRRAYLAHVSDAKRASLEQCRPALGTRRLIFVGTIYSDWRVAYKGLDLLVEAFAQKVPGWHLTIVGVSAADFLRRLPAWEHLLPKIDFIESTPDLPRLYETHDLMVIPARGDSFPTVVLEAMAAGLPVLVSQLTGNEEVVHELAPELVVAPNASAVVAGVEWYLALSTSQRQELGRRGREIAARFSEEASVRQLSEALNAIYSEAKARGFSR